MRALKAFAALAVMCVIGPVAAPPACAQEAPHPFRLYLGAFFPTKSETKDRVGDVVFSWGLSYDVQMKKPMPVTPFVYFDGVWASTDDYLNRSITFHYLGIGPGARYYFGQKGAGAPPQKSRFYVGGGFGIYFTSAQITDNNGFYVSTVDNDVKFGGKLLAGVEFGKSFLVEGDYTWPGASAANGWDLRVGFRF
jgi:outer membrane protein with beta-barrel domain